MNWLLLTAISVLFRSTYGLMTKVLSGKSQMTVFTQTALLSLSAGVIALLFSPLMGGLSFNFSQVNLWALLFIVVSGGLGNIIYFEAIKKLTNGTAQIAFSSILIFNTALALIFLNLHLSWVNVCGLILLSVAILMVVSGKVELHLREIGLMVLSAFLFSIFQLSSAGLAKQISSATYLVIANFGSLLVILLFRWKSILQNLNQIKNQKLFFSTPALTALPSLAYSFFAYYAYRLAPEPAKVAMLLPSQVVVTVVLSYIFLKEKTHLAIKIVAAVLVVIAAVLIKI